MKLHYLKLKFVKKKVSLNLKNAKIVNSNLQKITLAVPGTFGFN